MNGERQLSSSMLRRIRARCVTRARRYRRNHADFSNREELYFFLGAMAVLDAWRDPGAKALMKEWLADVTSIDHRPCDHSPSARAARAIASAERLVVEQAVRDLEIRVS